MATPREGAAANSADTTRTAGGNTPMLAARALIATLFLVSGVRKFMYLAATTGFFTKLGVPMPEIATPVIAAFEVIGGVLLLIGWRTRYVAWALAAFTLVATWLGHQFWTYDAAQYGNQLNHFLKNLAVIGGLLALAAADTGIVRARRR